MLAGGVDGLFELEALVSRAPEKSWHVGLSGTMNKHKVGMDGQGAADSALTNETPASPGVQGLRAPSCDVCGCLGVVSRAFRGR